MSRMRKLAVALSVALAVGSLVPAVAASASPNDDITPGSRIIIGHGDGSLSTCTVGPYVSFGYGDEKRYGALTAGHCGDAGDIVYRETSDGQREHISNLFAPVNTTDPTGTRRDYSLLPLDRAYVNPSIEGVYPPRGVVLVRELSAAYQQGTPVTLCAAGITTGMRCGPLVEVDATGHIGARFPSDHGDSGGPVWAKTSDGIRMVGLLRGNLIRDPSISVVVPIDMPLLAYDAKLVITES